MQNIIEKFSTPPGIHSIPLYAGRQLMRDAFVGRQFWLILIDAAGLPMVESIIRRHFPEGQKDEVRCIVLAEQGRLFAVLAMRKARLSRRQMQQELRGFGIFLTRREVAEKDVFIAVSGNALDLATTLADRLLSDPALPKTTPPSPIDQAVNWHRRN